MVPLLGRSDSQFKSELKKWMHERQNWTNAELAERPWG